MYLKKCFFALLVVSCFFAADQRRAGRAAERGRGQDLRALGAPRANEPPVPPRVTKRLRLFLWVSLLLSLSALRTEARSETQLCTAPCSVLISRLVFLREQFTSYVVLLRFENNNRYTFFCCVLFPAPVFFVVVAESVLPAPPRSENANGFRLGVSHLVERR